MKTNFQKELFSLVLFFIISINVIAISYTWTGATSTSWATSTNWSPAGVPSTSDVVSISNQTNNPQLTSNKTVSQLTINSGTLNLNSYTLTISSKSYFYGGTINNGLVFSSNAFSVYFSGTTFGAKVTMTGAAFYLKSSTFNDSLKIVKLKNSNLNNLGGNTFNSYVSYENAGDASIVFSDSLPDIFNSTLVLTNSGNGTFYMAHRAVGNQFNGDIKMFGNNIYFNYYGTATFSGDIHFYSPASEIYFGYSTGSSTLASGKTIILDSTISSGSLYFQNFTKSGSGSMNFALTGSSHLYFKGGTTFNSALTCSAPNMHLDGARFLGTSLFTNNGTANVTALGGNYFGGQTTIVNNSTSSYTFSLGSTVVDTFATTTTIQNNTGIVSINNAVFVGNVTLNNYDSSTTSNRFILNNTGQTIFKSGVHLESIISGMEIGVDGTSVFEEDVSDTITVSSGSFSFTNAAINKSMIFRLNATNSTLTLNGGNVFNGNLYFMGHDIDVHGTIFNGNVQITKYGSTDMTWSGGNVFNSTTTITDSSTSGHFLKMGNASSDTYNGNVTFIQKGSGGFLYPAYNYTSNFKGNVSVDGTSAITFGANNVGNIVFNGSTSQTINKLSAYAPIFKKITINKPGGTLTLNTPVTVTDSILFLKGIINSDTTNLITLNNFGKITGASDSSFVNGPFKKVGNAAFVFPIGKNISYGFRPVEITSPSNSTDAYTAQYIQQGQTLGNTLDTTIEHLNTCEYWKLTRNAGSSKVRLTINWNHDSCNIINPAYMRIAGWNGSLWKDFGTSVYSGDSIKGSSTTMDSTSTISVFTTAPKRCIYFKDVLTKHDVYCRGGSDGMAAVTVTGGTSPYKYSWSGSMGTQAATPTLYPGQYTVSISDSLGCHLSDTVVINEPDSLTISFTKTNSTCGDSSGVVSINATGGTGVVKQYFWTVDGETTQSHDSLSAGEYTVLVTDSNACSAFATVQVSDNNGPSVTLLTISPATCNGGSDGGALIQVASVNGPYKIRWSTSENDTLEEINNVSGGFYTVTVTDSVGCMSHDTIEVTQPNSFNVNLNIVNTHCGAAEGSATTVVTGGTPPYQYTWTYGIANRGVGETSSYIEHVNSGDGNVIVTDYHGCTTSKKFEILDIGGISVTGNVITNPTCFLDTTGSARVIVSGGTAPYSYAWYPNGGNNDTAVNLICGNYFVTVIDVHGCRQKANLIINSPNELKAYIYTTRASFDSTSDASAISIVYGGTAPYSYLWSSGETKESITNLSIGEDTLFVTDNNGCIAKNIAKIKSNQGTNCFRGTNALSAPCIRQPFNCQDCTTSVVRNIKTDFGAQGDGISDDECAFEDASYFFSQLDPLIPKKLIIPLGTYRVGKQDLPWNTGYTNSVLYFNNLENLTIEGEVVYHYNWSNEKYTFTITTEIPKLKFHDCMKYGLFTYPDFPFQYRYLLGDSCPISFGETYSHMATPGNMIQINECKNVTIRNLELDGNIDKTQIGGGYSDGFQIPYDGILINASKNVTINNLNVHHFGHDGLTLYYLWCAPWPGGIDPLNPLFWQFRPTNVKIFNSKFLYNGRNGFTWGGGAGLYVENTEFSYSGQSRILSQPGAGVDIEYEASNLGNINGTFSNCKFKYNKFRGMICDAGPGLSHSNFIYTADYFSRNVKFIFCTFVASEYGVTAYPNSRKFEFFDCHFYGRIWKAFYSPTNEIFNLIDHDNTKFTRCNFDEEYDDPDILPRQLRSFGADPDEVLYDPLRPNPSCPVGGHRYLVDFSTACRVFFTNCTIRSNFTLKTILISSEAGRLPLPGSENIFTNCTIFNSGLNYCECDWNLGSFFNSIFRGDWWLGDKFNDLHNPNTTRSCATYYIWETSTVDITNITRFRVLTPNYIVPKYIDRHDPNEVTKIFMEPWEPCPGILPYYPSCLPARTRNINKIDNPETIIKFYPNPSSDYLLIENADLETSLKISNIIGDLIIEKQIINNSFQVDIRNLAPGVYIINIGNSKSYKFIKL